MNLPHRFTNLFIHKGTIALAAITLLMAACTNPETTAEEPVAITEPAIAETPVAQDAVPGETADIENVQAGEVTGNVEEYLGQMVSVRGDVADATLGGGNFLLQDDQLFGGEEILVINASGETLTLTEEELADNVQVTGEVQQLVIADLEREYGLDLDPDLYAEYEDQPVIVAQAIALAPDPADVTANPEAFYNQTIAVEADIEEFLSPRIFKLDEDQFFGGQGLLVLSNVAELTEAALEAGQIEEGDVVVVTGVLRPFVRADFERDYDFAWDEGIVAELEAEYTNVPVLVANEIYPAAQ